MDSWITENDSQCTETKPTEEFLERRCNDIMCPHEYLPSEWSEVCIFCLFVQSINVYVTSYYHTWSTETYLIVSYVAQNQ